MYVNSDKVYVGLSVDIDTVINEDFYIENEKSAFNFYTIFYDKDNRAKRVKIEGERFFSKYDFSDDGIRYFRKTLYGGIPHYVLAEMMADINFAWKKFLKHKNVDLDPECNPKFSAYYDGFSGGGPECYARNKCQLVFGYALDKNNLPSSKAKNSEKIDSTFKFPKDTEELLKEFFFHVKAQQSAYQEIKEFPVEPDFNKAIDKATVRKNYSGISFQIIVTCSGCGE